MTQPFLILRLQSTTHAQLAVFTEVNGVLTQVGDDFGTIERSVTISRESVGYNRVVNWNNGLYAAAGSGVWKYDPETSGPWTQIHTFATTPAGQGELLGLMPVMDGDDPILVTAYPSTTSNAIFVHIDEDDIVTEQTPLVIKGSAFSTDPNWISPVSHKGKIYWAIGDTSNTAVATIGIYDIVGTSFTSYSSSAFLVKSQLCVHNGRIYVVGVRTDRLQMVLRELQAAGTAEVVIFNSPTNYRNDLTAYCGTALASIDGKLVTVFQSAIDTNGLSAHEFGAWVIELDGDGVSVGVTDISTIINPGINVSSANRFTYNWKTDTITTPGDAQYILEHSPHSNENNAVTNYRWNGSGNLLTDLGVGQNAWELSRTTLTEGSSGARVWHGSGTLQVSPPKFNIVGPNVDIDFVVYGANQSCVLGIMFDKKGDACETPGTIVQTDNGTIESIFASGILATPSGTPVRIKWSAAADGISTGDFPKVAGRIFLA